MFAGRYQVIEELGRGGMGRVYKVFDTEVKEKIALKLLRPEIAADKDAVERFSNELKLARKVSHRNVCRMFDLGKAEGTAFITMEFVPGEDLKKLIRKSGQLGAGRAAAIARQVCEGLREAHRLGVVHRDLKPQNIMIDEDGNVRIMDFGIARSLMGEGLTGSGAMIGTPEYMSPEQVEGQDVDQRSDIYSLGIILYEMLTGQAPFGGETALSIAMKHKTEPPKDPREINPLVPEGLSRLILKCLEKERGGRFQRVEEIQPVLLSVEPGAASAGPPVAEPPATKKIPETERKRSIAVLPFSNLSPEKEQEYFCDGLSEEIINALSHIRKLRVVARTSAFAFRGKEVDIREIGEKLNVGAVLEGSVRKSGRHLRITAQLVSVEDGFHLWSGQFDRDMKDIFDVQDEISLAIVDQLKLRLLKDEKDQILKRPTQDHVAYNLYLLGRYFLNRASDEEDFHKAIGHFERALEHDPGYAQAHVGLAQAYSLFSLCGYLAPRESHPKAIQAAQRALDLDEELGDAHATLGYLKFIFEWDMAGAEQEFLRALELNPGSLDVHLYYSMYLAQAGRFDEAIEGFKRVIDLDPAAPANYIFLGGWGYMFAGRYDEAVAQIEKGLDMDPSILWGHLYLASVYALGGRYEQAIAQADKVISAWPRLTDVMIFSFLGWVYAVSGRPEKARDLLNRMLDLRARRYVDAYLIAEVYAGLGEKELVFEWLNKAYEERASQMGFLKIDPWITNLHSDPRYKELLIKTSFER